MGSLSEKTLEELKGVRSVSDHKALLENKVRQRLSYILQSQPDKPASLIQKALGYISENYKDDLLYGRD
jgi:hypothetical protein